MSNKTLRITSVNDLPLGGFEGIVETRMVMSPKVWPNAVDNKDISFGLGDFIYLANGYFKPDEGVPMHPHQDVDIVSIILDGTVGHAGTLGDGTVINGPGVQVQRSGTGMSHSEFSMNGTKAHIIQVWFLPPKSGLKPEYKNYNFSRNELTTVLGGKDSHSFDSTMTCQVGGLPNNTNLELDQDFVVLVTHGEGSVSGKAVNKGDLIEGSSATLSFIQDMEIVLIQRNRLSNSIH